MHFQMMHIAGCKTTYALVTRFAIVIKNGSEKKGQIEYLVYVSTSWKVKKYLAPTYPLRIENARPSHELRTASGYAFFHLKKNQRKWRGSQGLDFDSKRVKT